jgi:hypothetical protein
MDTNAEFANPNACSTNSALRAVTGFTELSCSRSNYSDCPAKLASVCSTDFVGRSRFVSFEDACLFYIKMWKFQLTTRAGRTMLLMVE